MFESLGDRLQNAVSKIKGYGKITEDNISEMMREIRLALLEADVNYQVVKEFTNNVKEKALGEEVKRSIKPGDMFVKILNDELTELLGGEEKPLNLKGNPATLMLVGLQGSGKTTTIGKLANYLRKKHAKKPLLVACDVYRPAAIDQLKQLGKELNIEVYEEGKNNPVEIAKNAINYAKENNYQIDEAFIEVENNEIKEIYVGVIDTKEENDDYKRIYEQTLKNLKDIHEDKYVGKWILVGEVKRKYSTIFKDEELLQADEEAIELIINKDGTTNIDNIIWKSSYLIKDNINYMKMTLNNEYLDILVADNPLYKSIPHEYRYKKEG